MTRASPSWMELASSRVGSLSSSVLVEVEVDLVAHAVTLVMVVTTTFVAQGGRSALDSLTLMCWQRRMVSG